MNLSNMKVDSKAAEAGEWVKDIPDMEDLELRVRGATCVSARAMRNQVLRSLPATVRNDPNGIPLEKLDEIEGRILADVILLEWRNLEGIPYSKEKAAELLSDPDLISFRDAVAWASNRVGRRNDASQQADLGNSGSASAGT